MHRLLNTDRRKDGRLNILCVSDYPLREVMGGAVRVLYEQSKEFTARGHVVHVLTRQERFRKGYGWIEGVKEWTYPVACHNPFVFLKTSLLNGRRAFESICEEYPIDVLNCHQPISAFSVSGSPKSRTIGKCYTCHSLSFEEFQSRNPPARGVIKKCMYQLNIWGRKYLERAAMTRSRRIVVLSEFTKDKLVCVYGMRPDRINVIAGGVDPSRFRPARNRMRIRRRLGLSGERFILFTVRNLVPRMGLEDLVTAMKEVIKWVPGIYLVIGGEGPLKDELVAMVRRMDIEEHVRLTGFITEDELPDYYRMADVFVLPTRELEGFGLVTLEAMASGLPVLGTPVGGTREILGKFNRGFLFQGTDAESMASLIIETCRRAKRNPRKWKEISHSCRRFVEENYSWKKHVSALERVLREISEVPQRGLT